MGLSKDLSRSKDIEEADNLDVDKNQGKLNGSLIGYSEKINDEIFKKYLAREKGLSRNIVILSAISIPLVFVLVSLFIDQLQNTEALRYGLFIAVVYMFFVFTYIEKSKNSSTWDGLVKNKEQVMGKDDKGNKVDSIKRFVIIEDDEGKIHRIEGTKLYYYLDIRDKVRYHGGLNTFEKYDKSNDQVIYCNVCETKNDITKNKCYYCSSPLLK